MSDEPLRLYARHETYVSIRRVGEAYASILNELCTVVDDPRDAEVVMLHAIPELLRHCLNHEPCLAKPYVIGFFVWEGDRLTRDMQLGVGCADEVWVPSAFCHDVFSRYHPRVHWVPHLVEPEHAPTTAARTALGQILDLNPKYFNYLTITRQSDLRKNVPALIEAFAYVARRVPHARLIIKDVADKSSVVQDGSVTYLQARLPGPLLAALQEVAQVYVSAHCSEGWGLPLSDAMAMGQLAVATHYSGNLDFMTPHNSLLVDCSVQAIRPEHVYERFDKSLRWAYVHREALERQLMRAYTMHQDGEATAVRAQARADMTAFDRAHLRALLVRRVEALRAGLRSGSLTRLGRRDGGGSFLGGAYE